MARREQQQPLFSSHNISIVSPPRLPHFPSEKLSLSLLDHKPNHSRLSSRFGVSQSIPVVWQTPGQAKWASWRWQHQPRYVSHQPYQGCTRNLLASAWTSHTVLRWCETEKVAVLQMGPSAKVPPGAASLSFPHGQGLHRKALLRSSRVQMEARTLQRCSAWRNVSKVGESPRTSGSLGEKVD